MPDIIDRLITDLGDGKAATLAKRLMVKPQSITHWRNREIPLEVAISIETLHPGRYTVAEMAPRASRRIKDTMQSLSAAA